MNASNSGDDGFLHAYADLASWLGLAVSVVGIGFTIWTLIIAFGIKAKLMRRFQLPELIKEIQDGLTELSKILTDATFDAQALRVVIRRLSVTLKNTHKKTKGAEVAKALEQANVLLAAQNLTKSNGSSFYLEMTGAHQELFLEKRDDQWNI